MNKISENYYHYFKDRARLQEILETITSTWCDMNKYRVEIFISDEMVRASIYVMDKYDEVNL